LEVRRCGDGHPPVTKREREIRLNGISGVKFFSNARIKKLIRAFFYEEKKTRTFNVSAQSRFLDLSIERCALNVVRF